MKLTLAGRIFHLQWLPFWLYRQLFFKKHIRWTTNKHIKLEIMSQSPIDSSFTWIRLYLRFGKWWAYPIVIVSGYRPNCGIMISLFHKTLFDNVKWAQVQLWLREGHPKLAQEIIESTMVV